MTVLEYSVWICIAGAYFFTSVLLWFFDRSSPYSYRNDPDRYKNDVEKRYFTLKESLWFCITSLTPQGGGEAPKALSGRLVAATWWLFGFIVIASYTANLAAFLTVSRLDHPINNFEELTRQYKVKYAPFEGSSTKTYFERMARIEEKFYQSVPMFSCSPCPFVTLTVCHPHVDRVPSASLQSVEGPVPER